MTLSDYISNYRHNHNLSQRQLAALCGLSNSYIAMLEKGFNPSTGKPVIPQIPQLNKLCAGMHITIMELLESVDDMPIDISDAYTSNIKPLPQMSKIPLYGAIACGTPILAVEDPSNMVDLPAHIHADFALVCKGDSMINARIYDGDIVYIRRQDSVDNGEIAAVLIDDEATLKRVQLFPDHIVLEPENPQYRPLVYWESEMNDVRILGRAVAFTSAVL